MDFDGYGDPEPDVCIFSRFPWAWTLFTTNITFCIFRKILNRKFSNMFFAFCHHDIQKFSNRAGQGFGIISIGSPVMAECCHCERFYHDFKQIRKKHVGKFSIHKFLKNKKGYTCRKQCPCPGKSSKNAYNGCWVVITIKIHAFY